MANEKIGEIIAQRIRELMELKQIPSIIELERRVGLTREAVRQILIGRTTDPRINTVEKIARFFGVSTSYLIGETEKVDDAGILEITQAVLYKEGEALDSSQKIPLPDWLNQSKSVYAVQVAGSNLSPIAEAGDIVIIESESDYRPSNKACAFSYKEKAFVGFLQKGFDDNFMIKDAGGNKIGDVQASEVMFIGYLNTVIKKI